MDITRDVVFGVMANQKSLIDSTQLARAMAAQFQSGATLPDVIVGRGWMSATQCEALNQELDGALRKNGNDLQRVMNELGVVPASGDANGGNGANSGAAERFEHTLDSAVVAPPAAPDQSPDSTGPPPPFEQTMDSAVQPPPFEQTMDSQIGGGESGSSAGSSSQTAHEFAEHTRTMPPVAEGVDLQGADSAEPVQINTLEFTPEQCSRYTLTRVYGEGGLGQVWLAIDPSLKREVALKNIRPGKDDALARQRLIREAQITGQLEHPNIIPIYELEQSTPEATPYYTMRFLRGETLQEKIAAYQKHRKEGQVDPLELPELLNAFVDICHAIAYAGSRGVMHRDLKPQNIMLGDFGEVLVLDWGLAKQTGQAELASADQRAPIQLTPASDESQTVAGQVMGSPAYMAPEQATGRIDLMDPRTDIYGLGAILFAILTGKGPHRGERTGNTAKDTMALLKKISHGETPRLRDFDPTVPKPLEAICLRAMARDREDRYQNALELARDVQRFLADEPVSVYVEPWQQRAWRWVRRHRAWTQSVAAALVLTVVVSVVAFVFVNQARKSEVAAHAKTAVAKAKEEEARIAAETAKKEATARFQEARRAVDDSFTGISKELLNYPGVQELRTRLLEKAAAKYEEFAAHHSDDPELQLEFALALVRLGEVRRLLAAFPESEKAYQDAILGFEKLLEETPDSAELQFELAQCYNFLGMLHVNAGSVPDAADSVSSFSAAEKSYQTATEILAKQTGAESETPKFRRIKARILANQGVLLSWRSDFSSAIDALRKAAEVYEQLTSEGNKALDLSELAKTRISIAELMVQTGGNREAAEEVQRAIDCYEELVRQDADEPSYLQGLADARVTLGNAMMALGRTADRISLYDLSCQDYTALFKTRPDVPMYRERLANTQMNLAQVLFSLGRNDEARVRAEIALGLSSDLTRENPIAEHHEMEARCLSTIGQVLRDLQDTVTAETAFAQAEEKCTMLIEAIPNWAGYHRLRGEVRNNMGTIYLINEDAAAARQTFMNARGDFDKTLELSPRDAFAKDGLAWSLTCLGDTLHQLKREKEAKAIYELALDTHRNNGDEPRRQYQMARLLVDCQDEDFREPAEAAEIADRISKQYPDNADYLVLAAAAAYRQGQWQQCLEKLDEAAIRQLRGKSSIDFWRAMALYRQSAENPQARIVFERACARMEKQAPGDLKLVRLRDEANALFDSMPKPSDGTTPAPSLDQ